MGTIVFPDAPVKIFLTASAEIRAERRLNQLKQQGISATLRALICDIEKRDARDTNRKDAPLIPAADAIIWVVVITTTGFFSSIRVLSSLSEAFPAPGAFVASRRGKSSSWSSFPRPDPSASLPLPTRTRASCRVHRCAHFLANNRTSGLGCVANRVCITFAAPDFFISRSSGGHFKRSDIARPANAAPVSFVVTCVSHVVRKSNPPLRNAQVARSFSGNLSTAALINASRPLCVSSVSAKSQNNENFPSTSRPPKPSPTTRRTRFTSSLPSVASFASRRSCSKRSAVSSSSRFLARSRAASSSSGPSSESYPDFLPRFFFVFLRFESSSISSLSVSSSALRKKSVSIVRARSRPGFGKAPIRT